MPISTYPNTSTPISPYGIECKSGVDSKVISNSYLGLRMDFKVNPPINREPITKIDTPDPESKYNDPRKYSEKQEPPTNYPDTIALRYHVTNLGAF